MCLTHFAVLLTAVAVVHAETFDLALPAQKARFSIDLIHGNLAVASLAGQVIARDCQDEYWLEGDDGSITVRATEATDEVTRVKREANAITLDCRNAKAGIELTKRYAPAPVAGGLRKTVTVKPFTRRGVLHVFSRVRLAEQPAADAWLYTPRESWGGKTLLFGVKRLAEVKQPTTCSSGWDNRLVAAFQGDRKWLLAHWRSEVDGVWVPHSGVIAPWGQESPVALTYLPDGWRFRLLHCLENTPASASADCVLSPGDWYDAWATYRTLPGFRDAYRSLDDMPAWTRQVKYGTFASAPFYEATAEAAKRMCERLGPDAYLTIGVFGWSLDGDYETDRPFMDEGLSRAFTPELFGRCVQVLQGHPRAKVGLYVQGGLIDSEAQCFRDHPDWVIHGRDGKPLDSGFADNAVGRMYYGDPRVEPWVQHHLSRVRAVCEKYGCGFIYLDGGGFSEDINWARRQTRTFLDDRKLNERFFAAVRSTGRDRGLLCNSQNAPFADLSWLECSYFGPDVPWRETVDFCFDTECLQDPRYTLEPLYWADNDRYLAMCLAFGFTPCGDVGPDKPEATWRAIEAAWRMKPGRLILNSHATSPVWWRDASAIVTFAERVGDDIVIPVLNFGDSGSVQVTVDLAAVGLAQAKTIATEVYQPLVSADVTRPQPKPRDGKLTLDLQVPKSWRGVTLVTLRGA